MKSAQIGLICVPNTVLQDSVKLPDQFPIKMKTKYLLIGLLILISSGSFAQVAINTDVAINYINTLPQQ
jgi:hypothetical protein